MSQFIEIHPENPQSRLLAKAAAVLHQGGVIVYPTDSGYALGCLIEHQAAQQRIRKIKQVDDSHLFSLVCRDLTDIGNYAVISNSQFRLLKANTPGAYTFILKSSREFPRKLQRKRTTVGIRVPDSKVTHALLTAVDAPILNMSLNAKALNHDEEDGRVSEGWEIRDHLAHAVDLILDVGSCPFNETSMIDLTSEVPELIRAGLGDLTPFGLDDQWLKSLRKQ